MKGAGTAMVVTGTGHRLKNIHSLTTTGMLSRCRKAPGLVVDEHACTWGPEPLLQLESGKSQREKCGALQLSGLVYLAQSNNVLSSI